MSESKNLNETREKISIKGKKGQKISAFTNKSIRATVFELYFAKNHL